MAVGETQTLPQSERVLKTVGGDFPGFGEGWFRELRGAIDVNEVGLHRADHFARGGVGGAQGIQSLWFSTERNDEASARATDFSWQRKQFFLRVRLLGVRESFDRQGHGGGASQDEAQGKAAPERGAISSHDKFQLVFSSILYGLVRSCNALARLRYPRKNGTIAKAGKYIHQ